MNVLVTRSRNRITSAGGVAEVSALLFSLLLGFDFGGLLCVRRKPWSAARR